jgi:two-component system, NtrC family, sensor kinase
MKKLLLFFSFTCALYPALAQNINIDSLLQVAISRKSETKLTASPNRDSLLKLFPLTKSTPARLKLIYDIIYNYGYLNPKQASYYHNKILELTRKENDPVGEAIILSELGETYFQNGDIIKGQKMIVNALNQAEKTGNKRAIGIIYNNRGRCYPDDINISKSYYQKALQFSQASGDDLFVCFELVNLSIKYKKLGKTDSSNYYLMKSFELSVIKNVEQAIPYNLLAIGALQTDSKQKIRYYRAALNMPFTSKDSTHLSFTLDSIASYYKERGMIDSSLFYAKKAYNTANNLFLDRRIKPAWLLAQLYKDRNADSGLKYTNIYYISRDSMYSINKTRSSMSLTFNDQQRQREVEAQKKAYKNKWQFYILLIIITFLLVLAVVFWFNTRIKHKANVVLQNQKKQIQHTLKELKQTQQQLIQSEKMASLGELTAGIAHEIQNPLNFVNNFSEVSIEMLAEMELELNKGDAEEARAIAADIKENLEKIKHHGKRADSIVKGMLQHSRAGSSLREKTDLNKLADEYLRLAYHGLRAKDKTFDTEMKTNFDSALPLINIASQDVGRVLLNLFNNSFYAIQQKQKKGKGDYKPMIKVSTELKEQFAQITVWDNGTGIPANIKDKILQPFFTTKPSGEGTGLGLSLSYDIIVKEHNGKIAIDSKEGEYTAFVVSIPL